MLPLVLATTTLVLDAFSLVSTARLLVNLRKKPRKPMKSITNSPGGPECIGFSTSHSSPVKRGANRIPSVQRHGGLDVETNPITHHRRAQRHLARPTHPRAARSPRLDARGHRATPGLGAPKSPGPLRCVTRRVSQDLRRPRHDQRRQDADTPANSVRSATPSRQAPQPRPQRSLA
jgi:hypothetical protein